MLWLIYIISFLGAFAGRIIGKFTKEEVKVGRKYFLVGEQIILLILASYFLYLSQINASAFIYFILGLLVSFFFKEVYFYFALAFIMCITQNNLVLVSSLVFIYGLFHGSLGKKAYYILLYLIIPLILKDYLQYNHLYPLLAGSFFSLIFRKKQ